MTIRGRPPVTLVVIPYSFFPNLVILNMDSLILVYGIYLMKRKNED